MQILTFAQRSPEWFAARRGLPTASEFGNIITPKKREYAAAADTYINQLIDELVRPNAEQSFTGNRHTRHGELFEPEAADLYAFSHDVQPRNVGLILNDAGTLGCSPDLLIEDEGGLEIKCPDGPTHVKWVRGGVLPDEHKAQVHGSLIITGCDWWDFLSYCPGHRPLEIRVVRDDFTEKLEACLERFVREYEEAKSKYFKEAA